MFAPQVLVLGDAMLDRNVRGRATKLAPDRPYICFTPDETVDRPGGVANVFLNVAAARVDTLLILFRGTSDPVADDLRRAMMSETGRSLAMGGRAYVTNSCRKDRATHMKIRYMAGRPACPLLRVDSPDVPGEEAGLDAADLDVFRGVDASRLKIVLVSDYGRGVVRKRLFHALRERFPQAQIAVDPHPKTDPAEYANSDILKLNAKGYGELVSRSAGAPSATSKTYFVTNGPNATQWWHGGLADIGSAWLHFPPGHLPVVDPCGAGDVFFARFGAAFARRGRIDEACIVEADAAAAASVGREFTTVVYDDDADFKSAMAGR